MSDRKNVLLVEDEPDMAAAIVEAFRRSRRHDYVLETVSQLTKDDARRIGSSHFDICIIDLRLQQGGFDRWGFLATAYQTLRQPNSVIVVYSGHPGIDNVVKAMRLGATDFISKADCAAYELPARIERLLDEESDRQKRWRKLNEILAKHEQEWQQRYAGQWVAVVGEEVVASDANRLAAMIDYAEKRANHPDWPEDPEWLEYPGPDAVTN